MTVSPGRQLSAAESVVPWLPQSLTLKLTSFSIAAAAATDNVPIALGPALMNDFAEVVIFLQSDSRKKQG